MVKNNKKNKKNKKRDTTDSELVESNYNYNHHYEQDTSIIPFIVLASILVFSILALIFFCFMIASACFIVPIYLAITTKNVAWEFLLIITIPIGVCILHGLYHSFVDEIHYTL